MAAGTIAVAHNSAGPKEDIIVTFEGQPTGFLASTANEYAEQFLHILSMNPKERMSIQRNARRSVARFSEEEFTTRFKKFISVVL